MVTHDTPTVHPSFYFWVILSFVVLREFIERNPRDLDLAFGIKEPAAIIWHGVGGRRVPKTIRHNLPVVQSVRPDIVIVQLGTNDLSFRPPSLVDSDPEEFVRLLHDSYGVQFVCVCLSIRLRSAMSWNKHVDI